jgi:stage II sporulation protein D
MGALGALLAALSPGLLGVVFASPASAQAGPVVVIEGKGFGHGVGMAQDGAYAMAASGASAAAILNHFYPGTAIAKRSATIRVGVHESPGPVVVVLPGGGEVRDAPSGAQSSGFPVTVSPGGSVELAFDGSKYRATPLAGASITRTPAAPATPAATTPPTPSSTVPPTTATTNLLDPLLQTLLPTTVPPTTVPSQGPGSGTVVPASQKDALSGRGLFALPRGDSLVALPGSGRSYRGMVQAEGAGRGLNMVNSVDVEQYVRGMGEMPASWPAAALQAQAITARTFAVRAAAAGKTLCDHQQCQVYIGAGNEHPATSAAATATRGQVLTYKGALAEAVYSASAGGISATAEEGFGPGSPEIPYLKPVQYSVDDPQLWAMTLPLPEAGARFGYRGEVTDIRVLRVGPSGRPLEIGFDGSNGPMVVDGHRFWAELQLRSTLFTLRTEATPPVVEGEPLATRLPGDEAPFPVGDDPVIAAAEPGPLPVETALGRAPWIGLAVLLLAAWATLANRVTGPRPVPVAGAEEPPAGDEDAET